MTIDIALNLLGLSISLGGLVAAGLRRQVLLAVFACALICTTGVTAWLAHKHEREISQLTSEIKTRLSYHKWTFDRIHSELRYPDYKNLQEALRRAIENDMVKDQRTECTVSDGSVLSTRIYFSTKNN
jgi:uncharacterized membrane protein YfbV (UPF0208 family)